MNVWYFFTHVMCNSDLVHACHFTCHLQFSQRVRNISSYISSTFTNYYYRMFHVDRILELTGIHLKEAFRTQTYVFLIVHKY